MPGAVLLTRRPHSGHRPASKGLNPRRLIFPSAAAMAASPTARIAPRGKKLVAAIKKPTLHYLDHQLKHNKQTLLRSRHQIPQIFTVRAPHHPTDHTVMPGTATQARYRTSDAEEDNPPTTTPQPQSPPPTTPPRMTGTNTGALHN
eukprot:gene4800-3442_t